MNNIITKQEAIAIREANGQPTMSSLRIAEVTGKRHDNVVRDIESVFLELGIESLKFEDTYLSENNQQQKHYLLPEREFNLVVSGYSAKYRLELIDELMSYREAKPQLPTTYITALEALVVSEKAKQLALDKIERDKPKVEFSERIETAINSINIGSYAKVISKEHKVKISYSHFLEITIFSSKVVDVKTFLCLNIWIMDILKLRPHLLQLHLVLEKLMLPLLQVKVK
jgi:Rha family phage regulatory protein